MVKRVGTWRERRFISSGGWPKALAATLTAPRKESVLAVAATATP